MADCDGVVGEFDAIAEGGVVGAISASRNEIISKHPGLWVLGMIEQLTT